MNPADGPIVEIVLDVERDLAERTGTELATGIAELLALPGVLEARIVMPDADEGDAAERARRIVIIALESDQALLEGFADPSAVIRGLLPPQLADGAAITHRVLNPLDRDDLARPRCANCEARLTGQYCGRCGQRATARIISLWELLREATGDLLELDSRLWRTLIPLAARPGRLTADYLQGRRVRYMPPFRTYLVLSLIFFVAAFFDPQEQFGLLLEEPATAVSADADADADEAQAQDPRFNCEVDETDLDDMPPWLAARLTPERIKQLCERLNYDDAQGFTERMLDNLAIALYVLLPLMALVLKVLYPLSRRYYVEHLLFVVHFHAFVFLAMLLQLLFSAIVELVPTNWGIPLFLLIPLYVLVYLYKAMRHVYRQGRAITLFKYLLLLLVYFASFIVMISIAALFAAFSL